MMPIPVALADDEKSSDGQWTMGGQDLKNWRNQDDTDISPKNVAKLKPKWVFTAASDITATPAVADGVVYFPDLAGNFYALNATTGTPRWTKTVASLTTIPGDYARHDPAVHRDLVIFGNQAGLLATWPGNWGHYDTSTNKWTSSLGAWVMAVKAHDGSLKWKTQVEAFPGAMVTSSPIVYNDVVYVGIASSEEGTAANPAYPCCNSRGSVVALDVGTGKILWKTYTIPDNHGMTDGYSGGAVWGSTPVIDPKRKSVYVGVGNNFSVPIVDETCARTNPAANCYAADNYFDSVLALDLSTGAIKWATHTLPYDAWNVTCITPGEPLTNNCPKPTGPDYDFGGNGPNLFKAGGQDLVGIGQKSGIYWALNADNGKVVWKTEVGPGSALGGVEWGTATDGTRIYVPIGNWYGIPYPLPSLGNGGSWAALDPKTGNILWQVATPGECLTAFHTAQNCMALGPASVANGVVFAGSMDINPIKPTMFALDAKTGKILWSFTPGSSVVAGPAIVGNSVYWGSGSTLILSEPGIGLGTRNNKLYKFSIGDGDDHH